MTLATIAQQHRVPCKRTGPTTDDEKLIPGKLGHIWSDGPRLMVCYTDDPAGCAGRGPKRPLSKMQKTYAIQKLDRALIRITQMGDAEFVGQIATDYNSVELAIKILGIRRFKITKGISKPFISSAQTVASFSAKHESGPASR